MICDVIIPVGPSHEQLHLQAVESVRIASLDKGPFGKINIQVIDDTEAKLGRSRARNIAVDRCESDWIFFLDADDKIHPKAFHYMQAYYKTKDAIWGNILEIQDGICVWRYQVPRIESYKELLSFDPYITIGPMGHFVKTEIAKKLPFDEDMDCGEDWDFYLREWKDYNCIKIEDPMIINFRGQHSTGARSATGQDWMKVVHPMLHNARQALLQDEQIERDGYFFPEYDLCFRKVDFELEHILNCIRVCPGTGIALDCGAHVGGWTRELAKHFDKVIAFEPLKQNYNCLVKNTEGLDNVETINKAVSDVSATGSIKNDDVSNSGAGYLEDGSDFEVIILDDLELDSVDFIKIDVEGKEPNVLRGALETIRKYRPVILIEQKPQTARFGEDYKLAGRILEDEGYRLEEKMNKNYLYVPTETTACGPGSSDKNTVSVRRFLEEVIDEYSIATVNDAGCADLYWISQIDKDIDYLGYDSLIRKKATERLKSGWQLEQHNLVEDRMRQCDLVVCKDVFRHHDEEGIKKILANIQSSAKYLLSDYDIRHEVTGSYHQDLNDGDYYAIQGNFVDLRLYLGEPVKSIKSDEGNRPKRYGLWNLNEV